ncbi:MAG: hypothetical protein ACOYW3_11940 [Bacteroidota bacterium]
MGLNERRNAGELKMFFHVMSSIKRGKKEKANPAKGAKSAPPKVQPPDTGMADDENQFDFGGIPVRDLKKNLGCG